VKLGRGRENKPARAARRNAEYLLWHDGYPRALLGHEGDGCEGAVMVDRDGGQWAVYRNRAGEKEGLRLHADVKCAYDDALNRIYKICAAEGL
jgi:hypothetical protein